MEAVFSCVSLHFIFGLWYWFYNTIYLRHVFLTSLERIEKFSLNVKLAWKLSIVPLQFKTSFVHSSLHVFLVCLLPGHGAECKHSISFVSVLLILHFIISIKIVHKLDALCCEVEGILDAWKVDWNEQNVVATIEMFFVLQGMQVLTALWLSFYCFSFFFDVHVMCE